MNSAPTKPETIRPRFVYLALVALTLLVYWPVSSYDYVVFDDQDYVTENEKVQAGLTWAGIRWAFTSFEASNWHPVTWLSHMLDCELFGMNPGAHHLVNVLFHAVNAVLLFLFLFRATRAFWPSALVAAVFAWHPLRVESVAWIAERKDVLSLFFALLALLAYARHVQNTVATGPPATGRTSPPRFWNSCAYWWALLFFALGLMAKPMLVTLPFIFLLLDYWPFQRIPELTLRTSTVGRIKSLVWEKWPFFVLTIASCVLTFLAQRSEAVANFDDVSLKLRLGNVVVSYFTYLSKAIAPVNLAVLYPLPQELPAIGVVVAAIVVLGISILVWRARVRSPFGLMGWLWYLGALVPVIGLVQTGNQALADRYTYLPMIGLAVAVIFAIQDLARRHRWNPAALFMAGSIAVALCLVATRRQLRHWENTETLFRHTLAVTKNNDIIHSHLGAFLMQQNRPAEAIAEFEQALKIDPNYALTQFRMGHAFFSVGEIARAIIHFQKAVELQPDLAEAHNNLGNSLLEIGRPSEAIPCLQRALKLQPKNEKAHFNLGRACHLTGALNDAAGHFQNALSIEPAFTAARVQLAAVLLNQGQSDQAIRQLKEALRADPDNVLALLQLARVLAAHENPTVRNGAEAIRLAERANTLTEGGQPFVLDTLAMAYAETGRFTDAQRILEPAIARARSAGWADFVSELQARLKLYESAQPYREDFAYRAAVP